MKTLLIFVMLINNIHYDKTISSNLNTPAGQSQPSLMGIVDQPSARAGLFTMRKLTAWVPYNELIGDAECTDMHLVKVVEEFKPIIGFEGHYEISSFGRAISMKFGRRALLMPATHKQDKYFLVNFCKDKKQYTKKIHRLVAIHFLSNPNNHPLVNHKKGNRQDNRFWMLEWCNQRENATHAFLTKKTSSKYPGVILDKGAIKKPWTARIKHNGKNVGIGYFHTEELAFAAYRKYLSDNNIVNKYIKS